MFNYLDEYEDTPWTALKYLIGNIFYGGNVFDIWDKRLLDTYINQFFNENSITTSFYKYGYKLLLIYLVSCKRLISFTYLYNYLLFIF